jgi:hypothetical protein
MEERMTSVAKIAAAALLSASAFAWWTSSASAEVVCNGRECWHVHGRYDYPPDAGIVVHPDNWRWGPQEKFTWREHEGRGYWHGDTWREF